jgi:hypothetical protein
VAPTGAKPPPARLGRNSWKRPKEDKEEGFHLGGFAPLREMS